MLEIRNLTYHHGSVQFKFDLSVNTGQILCLLGPSGAGKSTLLDLIAGFLTPEHGAIEFCGEDLLLSAPANRPVTSLFQQKNLFLHLKVRDNLALGIHPGMRLTSAQKKRLEEVARMTGLMEQLDKYPQQLSGGQQQRVALARSLLRNKPLLLLDEPFSALDPSLRSEMLRLVRQLAREHRLTVLMVTHHPEDAKVVADELLFIILGKSHCQGPVSLLDNPPSQEIRDYLGQPDSK
ncbi:thiamine ABC transporter ATP-binding protein [Dongshaea marina]|uniref:thiamine ABC transporter ATP-binding protein n=1 Tax=Dongshaea marina TaxID=2047966 RepID=UPI000D3E0911|nr:thiamine ABC transporter ATP-binding protein [Dongshaea marina]